MKVTHVMALLLTGLVAAGEAAELDLSESSPNSFGFWAPPAQAVLPPPVHDLSVRGDFDLGGFVFKEGHPLLHVEGGVVKGNTALGLDALRSVTPGVPHPSSGSGNTAFGSASLRYVTEGIKNTGVGVDTLSVNQVGHRNTAVGSEALRDTPGSGNTAVGAGALTENASSIGFNTAVGQNALNNNIDGDFNTAVGQAALIDNNGAHNTVVGRSALKNSIVGSNNIAIGAYAGSFLEFEAPAGSASSFSNNIIIGSGGAVEDENRIRIGRSSHTATHIAGVHNTPLSNSGEHPICVDDADQLGICSVSSIRFKSQVQEMGSLSSSLLELRPVVFYYKHGTRQGSRSLRYGLIAEEVGEVFPHLVTYDDHGDPLALRYELLTPLLLNELKRQHRDLLLLKWLIGLMLLIGGCMAVRRLRLARA